MSPDRRFRLDGRRALVTGASRGIGRAIVLAFARAGAEITLSATDADRLQQVAREVEATGARAHVVPADLADPNAPAEVVERAHTVMGGLDVLVNGAAVLLMGSPAEITPHDFDRMARLNLRAPVLAMRYAGAAMRATGGGVIINLSSAAAEAANGVYGSLKAALESYTLGLAREWGPHGIRVVAIAPGVVDTDMADQFMHDPAIRRGVLERTYLGRTGTPEEIAAAAVYLASDAASYVTGIVLPVSGGWIYRY